MPVVHFRHETLGLLSPVAGRQGSDLAPHSLYGWVELVRGPISRSSTLGDYLRRHDLDSTGPALTMKIAIGVTRSSAESKLRSWAAPKPSGGFTSQLNMSD